MDFPEKKKLAYAEGERDGGEFFANVASRVKARKLYPSEGDRWGNWEFAADTLHLLYKQPGGREQYNIPLRGISDSAEMLDWVFQVRMKTWISSKDIGDLVQAFDDLLEPQATLCGQGVNQKLNPGAYINERMKAHSSKGEK